MVDDVVVDGVVDPDSGVVSISGVVVKDGVVPVGCPDTVGLVATDDGVVVCMIVSVVVVVVPDGTVVTAPGIFVVLAP